MVGNVNNNIGIPFFGFVYLIAVIVVAFQHFSGLNFGALGVICWLIVIIGAIGFLIYVVLSALGEI